VAELEEFPIFGVCNGPQMRARYTHQKSGSLQNICDLLIVSKYKSKKSLRVDAGIVKW
jgi:hypothetical protein